MKQTISIIVSGRVQRVFYRQSTKEMATAHGITGHVRNAPDDTVHIIATGTKGQLDKFLGWCRQGPPKARVTGIEVLELPLQEFDRFTIERF